MVVKVMRYSWNEGQPKPECDSCNKVPVVKIFTEKDGKYQVGIRLCEDCYETLLS